MKKWKTPKLDRLDLDCTKSHICHRTGGECTDSNLGLHDINNHYPYEWFDGHFHTHCCFSAS